jgi:1-acyl-sn-glycerol-3-phosphate acyltransferase
MYRPSVDELAHGSAALRRRGVAARALARILGRIEADGLDRVPRSGPVVLAVNHRAFLDGPLLFALLPRPVAFLVKVEAYTRRAAPLLNGTGQIPVVRSTWNIEAVRQSLRILRAGGIVGVFPEGTRGDGLVRTAKPGVGYFALRTGAQVVPVACHGTHLLGKQRRPHVRIAFGEPLDFGRVADRRPVPRADVLAATEKVRAALADLVACSTPAGVGA